MSDSIGGNEIARPRSENRGWTPRPVGARAVRAAQVILPFVAGWLAIRALQSLFIGAGEDGWVSIGLWLVQAIVVATVVSAAVARVMRRFTPLVSLLNMSLVFPDSVPSRFGLALRTGTVRRLMAEPTLRLSGSAQEAAEQAVQLVTQLGKHEPLTRGHTERVRAYADVIGQQMGLSDEDLNGLRWGALLHDVGKLTVPAEILNKPGKPTVEEWEILRGHPGAAVPILEPLQDWLGDWLLAAPQHHERWDGSGYPNGISGREISLGGRITAVADAYDVITSRRSYKAPKSAEFAREEMVRSSGSHFDPVVVRALLEAGVTKSAYARRMGWILELPGIARALGTAGQAVATAVVAVAVSAAVSTGAPSTTTTVVDTAAAPGLLAFSDEASPEETVTVETSDSVEERVVSEAPRTTEPVDSSTSTTSSSIPEGPLTGEDSVSTVAPTAPSVTTTAPTTTAAPAITSTTTTRPPSTTTTTASTADCQAVQSGQTFLPNADLRGCNLANMTLDGLHLTDARLDGANLANATLTNFNMNGANLTGANLTGASLSRGSFVDADLSNISANRLTLSEVGLQQASLTGAMFGRASFTLTSFLGADARGATFSSARFANSDFREADLRDINFSRLNFRGMSFQNARIGGVDFGAADLTETQFFGATGIPSNVSLALFQSTTCPNGSTQNTSCW